MVIWSIETVINDATTKLSLAILLLPYYFRLRHSALTNVSTLEPNGLCRDDQKRPDGLTRFPFKNGKSLCWDSTQLNFITISLLAMPDYFHGGSWLT